MQYRRLPRVGGLEISALGLGLMRLPQTGPDPAAIDLDKTEALLRAALDAGVNYLDTAYIYHKGESEKVLGALLAKLGVRDRVLVATKSPVWLVEAESDWERLLDEQLARLGTDHVDFYLLHALTAERWEKVLGLKGLEAMEKAKRSGKIRHLGFSFHDRLPAFKTIVDGYGDWEFCQVQYNYMDVDFQAGAEGIAYAAEREIGTVVMEPLRGGVLARAPKPVLDIFARHPRPRMPAEWALRFCWERQEVATVLSGMGSAEQLWENAAVAEAARANSMTRAELALVEEARAWYRAKRQIPCTSCGYCGPCPSGVSIPEAFELYNDAIAFDDFKAKAGWYRMAYVKAGHGADRCTTCGLCVPKCPQGIAIPDRLAAAHDFMKE